MKRNVVGRFVKVAAAYALAFALTVQPVAGAVVLSDNSIATLSDETTNEAVAQDTEEKETKVKDTEVKDTEVKETEEIAPEQEGLALEADEEGILKFPENVTHISKEDFVDRDSIKKVILPKDASAEVCEELVNLLLYAEVFQVDEANPNLMVQDDFVMSKDGKTFFFCNMTDKTEIKIPDGITRICAWAINGSRLEQERVTIYLPSSLGSVGRYGISGYGKADLVVGDANPTDLQSACFYSIRNYCFEEPSGTIFQFAKKQIEANPRSNTRLQCKSREIRWDFVKSTEMGGRQDVLTKDQLSVRVLREDGTAVTVSAYDAQMLALPMDETITPGMKLYVTLQDAKKMDRPKTFAVVLDENRRASIGKVVLDYQPKVEIITQGYGAFKAYLYDQNGRFLRELENPAKGSVYILEDGNYYVLIHRGPEEVFKVDQLQKLGFPLIKGFDYELEPISVVHDDVHLTGPLFDEYVDHNPIYDSEKSSISCEYDENKAAYKITMHVKRANENPIPRRLNIDVEIPRGLSYVEDSFEAVSPVLEGDYYPSYYSCYYKNINVLTIFPWPDQECDEWECFFYLEQKEGEKVEGNLLVRETCFGFPVFVQSFADDFITLTLPGVTKTSQVVASGETKTNRTVILMDESEAVVGETKADNTGKWSITFDCGMKETGESKTFVAKIKDTETKSTAQKIVFMNAEESLQVDDFTISALGKWKPVDLQTCSGGVISYAPRKVTSFQIKMAPFDGLKNLVLKGEKSEVKLSYDAAKGYWVGQSLGVTLENQMDLVCVFEESFLSQFPALENTKLLTLHVKWIIDPSGYIYEVTEDNRIEGAKVEVYDAAAGSLWDAIEYEQVNPLFSDENGYYAWDVPVGQYYVSALKEGYKIAKSSKFTIPPARTDVNLELIYEKPICVVAAELSHNKMVLQFDHHAKVASFTDENVSLLAGEQKLTIKEVTGLDTVNYKGTDVAKRIEFTFAENLAEMQPEKGYDLSIPEITKASYSNTKLCEVSISNLRVTGMLDEIRLDNAYVVKEGENFRFDIMVLPAELAKGKEIKVAIDQPEIAEVVKTTTIGKDGKATFVIKGKNIGQTAFTVCVNGFMLSASQKLDVVLSDELFEKACEIEQIKEPIRLTDQEVSDIKNPSLTEDETQNPPEDDDDSDENKDNQNGKNPEDNSGNDLKPGNQVPGDDSKPGNSLPGDEEKQDGKEDEKKPATTKKTAKKGSVYTVKNLKYKVLNADTNGKGTVAVVGVKSKTKTTVTIEKTVKLYGSTYKIVQISDKAFKGYKKLKKITIGENVTKIGKYAFDGCGKLKRITIKSKKLTSVGKNALKGVNKDCRISVPRTKFSKYKKLFARKGQKKTVKITKL